MNSKSVRTSETSKTFAADPGDSRIQSQTNAQEVESPLKLTSRLGERGQVVIPKEIRDRLRLAPHAEIEFELKDGVLTVRPKRDMEAFRKHLDKWRGALAGQLKRDGFDSVDDYMRVIRGR